MIQRIKDLGWILQEKQSYLEDYGESKIIVNYKDFHDNNKFISYDSKYFWSLTRAIDLWNLETIDLILMQLEFNNEENKIEKVLNKIECCYSDWTSHRIDKRKQALNFVEMVNEEFNIYKKNGPTIKVKGNEMTVINDNMLSLFGI